MTATRDLVAALATELPRRVYGNCIYCGHPCHGLACRGHRDLLRLDPNQYLMRLRTNEPIRAAATEGAA